MPSFFGFKLFGKITAVWQGQEFRLMQCLQSLRRVTDKGPSCCGSVDWAPACEPKGPWFDSQSGHIPGLQARSPWWGVHERQPHWCFFPSLLPPISLPSPLSKINEWILKKIRVTDKKGRQRCQRLMSLVHNWGYHWSWICSYQSFFWVEQCWG